MSSRLGGRQIRPVRLPESPLGAGALQDSAWRCSLRPERLIGSVTSQKASSAKLDSSIIHTLQSSRSAASGKRRSKRNRSGACGAPTEAPQLTGTHWKIVDCFCRSERFGRSLFGSPATALSAAASAGAEFIAGRSTAPGGAPRLGEYLAAVPVEIFIALPPLRRRLRPLFHFVRTLPPQREGETARHEKDARQIRKESFRKGFRCRKSAPTSTEASTLFPASFLYALPAIPRRSRRRSPTNRRR